MTNAPPLSAFLMTKFVLRCRFLSADVSVLVRFLFGFRSVLISRNSVDTRLKKVSILWPL